MDRERKEKREREGERERGRERESTNCQVVKALIEMLLKVVCECVCLCVCLVCWKQVEVEQISDDEWILTRTRDLKRHGVLGRIVDQVPPYVINIDYRDDASVHLGNQLVPLQTQQQPVRIKSVSHFTELFELPGHSW